MSATTRSPEEAALRRERWLVGLALGALCLLLVRAHLTRREFVSDDAWISMRYARNLVEGHGLLWNPGQEPVEGYSNLLWVLLGALGLLLGAPLPGWLAVLGLGMCAGAVLGTYATARVAGARVPFALFAAALCAVSSMLSGISLLGLETPSLVLLMTLGTWQALREEEAIRAGREGLPWSALLFGLLTIAHVEGPLYLAIPALIRAARHRWGLPGASARVLRQDWIAAAVALAFPLGQEILRLAYYGDWMPNTVRVKSMGAGEHVPFVIGVRYVLFSLVVNKALAALTVVGVVAALARRRGVGELHRRATLALTLPWLCCAAFSIVAKGDMLNQFRFMAPATPTLLALTALGWQRLLELVPRAFNLAAHVLPLALALPAAWRDLSIQTVSHDRSTRLEQLEGLGAWLPSPGDSLGTVRELPRPLGRLITGEPPRPEQEIPWFVAWVLETVPVGGTVMFPDVGLLGYALSDGNVLDARGLNSRGPMALLAADPPDGPEGMQDPGVRAFLQEFHALRPAALVLQTSSGVLWGPPEAALQGDGALYAYRGVATGPYSSGWTRVYTLDLPPPSKAQILARYRRLEEELPGVFDWRTRRLAIERGVAAPAEQRWSGAEEVQLAAPGAWSEALTFPPRGGG